MPSNTVVQASVVGDQTHALGSPTQAETINVSGAGMALLSQTSVEPGTCLSISIGQDSSQGNDGDRVVVEVIECLRLDTGGYVLRCRRKEGQIPAQLILDW